MEYELGEGGARREKRHETCEEISGNMKKYVESMKKYVGNMKEISGKYEEVCGYGN